MCFGLSTHLHHSCGISTEQYQSPCGKACSCHKGKQALASCRVRDAVLQALQASLHYNIGGCQNGSAYMLWLCVCPTAHPTLTAVNDTAHRPSISHLRSPDSSQQQQQELPLWAKPEPGMIPGDHGTGNRTCSMLWLSRGGSGVSTAQVRGAPPSGITRGARPGVQRPPWPCPGTQTWLKRQC